MKQSEQQFEEDELMRYENSIREQQAQQNNQMNYSSSMFGGGQKQNLVEWQLDFSKELIEIERLLRSDVLIRDKEGNEEWIPNPNKEHKLFNEVGVQDLLRYIYTMVNKNKVLSNYDDLEIKIRVWTIKHELRVLIYNNFETYGMDNEYKMNNYSMVVHTIGSLIEDAYRRAMNGEERRDLNSARMVNQNEPMMPQNINMYPQMQQKKGIVSRIMPWNWMKN